MSFTVGAKPYISLGINKDVDWYLILVKVLYYWLLLLLFVMMKYFSTANTIVSCPNNYILSPQSLQICQMFRLKNATWDIVYICFVIKGLNGAQFSTMFSDDSFPSSQNLYVWLETTPFCINMSWVYSGLLKDRLLNLSYSWIVLCGT